MTETSARRPAPGLPLLATKLYIPPHRPNLVPRPRLLARLQQGLGARLILICGPAGFGKTTLLAEWIAHCAEERRSGGAEEQTRTSAPLHPRTPAPVAWLSLDPADNDPTRFLTYLIAALHSMAPGTGQTAQELLHAPQSPAVESVLTLLVNDLCALTARGEPGGRHYVLVLEDYHTITAAAIHEAVTFLLDSLPPAMHLVIATRADPPLPLARLRARRQIVELRADDLRFTPEEVVTFLNDTMGLGLSAEDIRTLETRTEGWIAGLQLAALSLQGRADASSFIRAFSGSHRYVLDYLAEEVLTRQPEQVSSFLLQTSILERLSGPLCDAVLGDRENSQSLLEHLEKANLFIVPLDEERRWYRYHHLFADALRNRLQQTYPERIAELHRRASEWCEANGYSPEAIAHALAASDYERAADLVERHGQEVLWRGEAPLLRDWLRALPEAIIRPRPFLCLGKASLQNTPDDVERWLQAAELSAAAGPPPTLPPGLTASTFQEALATNIASIRVQLANWRGAPPQKIVELVTNLLATVPPTIPGIRASLCSELGSAYLRLGQEDAAAAAFLEAETLSRDSNVALAMGALYERAAIPFNHGRLRQTAAIFREALHAIVKPAEEAGRRLPAFGAVYVGLGRVLLEFNDLDAAAECLTHGLELISATLGHGILVSACLALSRLHCARRDFAAAQAALDRAQPICTWNPSLIPTLRVHAWLSQANWQPVYLEEAIRWAAEQDLAQTERLSPAMHGLARTRIFQRRLHGAPDLGPILQALDEGLQLAAAAAQLAWTVDLLALKALALQAEGRDAAALAAVEQALAAGEAEGYCRTLLQHGQPMAELLRRASAAPGPYAAYAGQLLSALERELQPPAAAAAPRPPARPAPPVPPEPPRPRPPALVEPLSARELEILRLLNTPLSSTEIAAQLFVSANTVRTHMRNIYGKLGVHDRVAAVVRAQEAGLL